MFRCLPPFWKRGHICEPLTPDSGIGSWLWVVHLKVEGAGVGARGKRQTKLTVSYYIKELKFSFKDVLQGLNSI